MAVTLFWRCEGTTLDGTADFTAADNTATANNTPAISATGARIGTNGLVFDSSSDRYDFNPASIVSPSAGALAGWFQFPSNFPGSGAASIVFVRGNASSNDHIQILTQSGSGASARNLDFIIRNATNGGVTLSLSGNLLAPGTWYFFTCGWSAAATTRTIAVYDTAGALVDSASNTVTDFTANVPAALDSGNGLRYGDTTGSTGTLYMDNLFAGSAHTDVDTFLANREITTFASYNSGSTATLSPTQATITLFGRTATVNTFSTVFIREVLVNAAGSAVTNRTGISLLVWYGGAPVGAPDLSYSALTTDANGTASWSLATGSLLFGQTIFYLANDGGASLSAYTCARMVPTYQ
jgi:hypothetical protein